VRLVLLLQIYCCKPIPDASRVSSRFRSNTVVDFGVNQKLTGIIRENIYVKNSSVYIQCKSDIVVVDIKQHKSQFKNSNFTITPLNWPTPKTIPSNHKLRLYLIHSRSYDSLKHCLIFPIGAIVIFHIFVKKIGENVGFKFCNPQKALPCVEPRHMSHRALKSVQSFFL